MPKPIEMLLSYHSGSILAIVANQYRSLMDAILEAIQNALDAYAKKINVNINQKTRNVFIQDDGRGASIDHMRTCLSRIGITLKTPDKLGRYGIGVVASFGKCKRFSFTSTPADKTNGTHRWSFNCSELAAKEKDATIPCVPVIGHDQWWASELHIESYVKDQLKSEINFDAFCTAIYDRYGATMLRRKTTINLKLTSPDGTFQEATLPPNDFAGHPLPVQTYDGDLCGKTTIRMFIVKKDEKSKRRGQGVRLMDHSGFTIPLSEKAFPGLNGGPLLRKKDADILQSGVFEGEIALSSKVKLDTSRKFFEESMVTLEAVSHIEKWLDEVGRGLIKQIEDEETEDRYVRLGNQSLLVIDQFLREQDSEDLLNIIKAFKWGSQGKGHAQNEATLVGSMLGVAIHNDPQKKHKKSTASGNNHKKPTSDPKEHPGHRPMITITPGGKPRKYAKHDSTGLAIHHQPGGVDLWSFDRATGIITINTAHPTWVASDRLDGSSQSVRDLLTCQLQERIILHTLISVHLASTLGVELEDVFLNYAHKFEHHHNFLAIEGDKIAKRGRYSLKAAAATNKTKSKDSSVND